MGSEEWSPGGVGPLRTWLVLQSLRGTHDPASADSVDGSAQSVDPGKKQVRLSDGRELPYDKLILGVGASPVIPAIDGRDLNGVFTLRSLSDAEKMKDFIKERKPRKLLFIGTGFISLEVATILVMAKPDHYDVTIVELLGHPLPLMLDTEIGVRVKEYLVDTVEATRGNPDLLLGASPRATLFLLRASRTRAAIEGRHYVTPDDVKTMLRPVLTHRLIMRPEVHMRGTSMEEIVDGIVTSVPVPGTRVGG